MSLQGPNDGSGLGAGGQSIEAPGLYEGGTPVGGPSSLFNIMGAPIAVLGGVFEAGLPIGGPVSQIFRGVGPVTPELFIATLSPGGPIGAFFIGSEGAPVGVDTFGGGGLPISLPPAEAVEVEAIEPLTALVGPAAIFFGTVRVIEGEPIGPTGIGSGGEPIGGGG